MPLCAAERFRKALRLVREEEDAAVLSKASSPRSKTVHAGRLHGAESVFGAFTFPGFLTSDPVLDFTWGLAFRMRNASRDLLHLAFTRGVPAAPPVEPEQSAE